MPITAEKVRALRAAVESILGTALPARAMVSINVHLSEERGDTDLYLDLIGDGREEYFPPNETYRSGAFVVTMHVVTLTRVGVYLRLGKE